MDLHRNLSTVSFDCSLLSIKAFYLKWSHICIFPGCPIPLADDPDAVVIPERTPDTIPKSLSYISVDEKASEQSPPLFGGHQSWLQREESFKLNKTMKVDDPQLVKLLFSLYMSGEHIRTGS